jgi:hypothetical protein
MGKAKWLEWLYLVALGCKWMHGEEGEERGGKHKGGSRHQGHQVEKMGKGEVGKMSHYVPDRPISSRAGWGGWGGPCAWAEKPRSGAGTCAAAGYLVVKE